MGGDAVNIDAGHIFSHAAPNSLPLHQLQQNFQKKLISSLGEQVSRIEQAVKIKLPMLREALQSADCTKRFNPAAYAVHWNLVGRISAGDAQSIMQALQNLTLLLKDDLYAPEGCQIRAVDDDLVDVAMREYLLSPEGPRGPNGELPVMEIPDQILFSSQKAETERALAILADVDPDMFAEFEQYAVNIKLFSGRVARGMTSVRAFGQIYLRFPDAGALADAVPYYVSHITHEVSHLQLHAMMAYDPLILNPDSERFSAPIRPDLRPLYGIYHAAFVLSRMIRVFRRWSETAPTPYILKELEMYRGMLQKGLTVLHEHGRMTDHGRQLLDTLPGVAEGNS